VVSPAVVLVPYEARAEEEEEEEEDEEVAEGKGACVTAKTVSLKADQLPSLEHARTLP